MRKLMINTILATDMGVHAQYMLQLGKLSEVVAKQGQALEGISQVTREEYRELLCCLLIKCADICNVVCGTLGLLSLTPNVDGCDRLDSIRWRRDGPTS